MKIIVKDKKSVQGITFPEKWIVISITDSGSEFVKFKCDNLQDELHLQFDDVDDLKCSAYIRFNLKMAEQIWKFVEKNAAIAPNCLCLVHCNTGMSRSPAIASAIDECYGQEPNDWFKNKTPNMFVYKAMLVMEGLRLNGFYYDDDDY